jgi:putative lipoic acid-binding regulatory protein
MAEPRFEDLVDFPTTMTLRVMCAAEPGIRDRCVQRAERITGHPVQAVAARSSAKGNYIAHHLEVLADSADQLRKVYAGLKALDGVRLVL